MLNIGKLRKGGELYYLNSVARGVEDYYTNSGEAPGYWLASGGRELELEGQVDPTQLRAVLAGRSPSTGERLTGKRARRERVPGFDLTFRAPKSVSLLHALGDKEASNEVVSAHNAAVAAALDYLERHASSARRGHGGVTSIASDGFVAAGFRHRSSRAGDPLLHTHVLVANMVKGSDGRWSALDARLLYKHAKTAGYLYQAHLRAELSRRLAIEWKPVRSGCAELAGVPSEAIGAFSQRRNEILAEVAHSGATDARAAQVAALKTRQAKDYSVRPEGLRPQWQERAAAVGLDERALARVVARRPQRVLGERNPRRLAGELADAEGLTAQDSTFTRRDVIQAICARLTTGGAVAEVETLADGFLASSQVVELADGLERGEERYSTHDMLAVEAEVLELALARQSQGAGVADAPTLENALAERPSLFPEQQDMVRRLTTSGHGVEVVIGKAGTGKTFALDAARAAWQGSGLRVIGCALSARAAEELEHGSGIPSATITTLLNDLDDEQRGRLDRSCVLVVDEAGMVGTRVLEALLTHAESGGAKVVLVGDDRQLPEIEAGGAFRALKERTEPVELTEVRRQPAGWERFALDLLREGRSQEAIESYRRHERVVVTRSAEETRNHLIADWWVSAGDGEPAVMVAARRSDVADLNARARAVMKAAGRLPESDVEIAGQGFAPGDRVMTLSNSRRLGVKNGTRATLVAIDAGTGATLGLDDGAEVQLPPGYLEGGHLTHAYAITGHKAQGMTSERAFVLGDQTLYREWAYVAMSRGREENRLYVVSGIDPERDELGGQVAAPSDPLDELVAAAGRSRAKDLALDSSPESKVHVRERALELE